MISEKTIKVSVGVAVGLFVAAVLLFHPAQEPARPPTVKMEDLLSRLNAQERCRQAADRREMGYDSCLKAMGY